MPRSQTARTMLAASGLTVLGAIAPFRSAPRPC